MISMRFYLTTFLLFVINSIYAQYTISGKVTDSQTGEALIAATIQSSAGVGTTTDNDGMYSIEVAEDETVTLTISYIGYTTATKEIEINSNLTLNIELKPNTSILDQVVITGSLNEKLIADEPVSLEVIKPTYIERNNITSLTDVVARTPGIQILDEQANIRNSGYSLGAGSRVGLIVDGQPLLSGMLGDVKWNFVPIENIDRIEIMKGASSVLYGSATMNGVINVQTAWPTSKPYTNITFYGGQIDDLQNSYKQWWGGDTIPQTLGVFVSHRLRIKKFDLVLGGNIHESVGFLKDLNQSRSRFNWKTRYRLNDKVSFGINGNVMNRLDRRWLIWEDADTNAFKHLNFYEEVPLTVYSIDPHLNIRDKFGNQHSVKGRYFNVIMRRGEDIGNAPAYVLNGEYLYKRAFTERMKLTAGVSYQYLYGESITGGNDVLPLDTVSASATLGAVFTQIDASFFDNKLNIIAGLRGERYSVVGNSSSTIIPVSRLSALYKLGEKNRLRANFGQGYRVPSLFERLVETPLIVTGVPLFPSINLLKSESVLPEIGWSAELGYKQLFKNKYLDGYIDFALFNMEYRSLAEFTFGYHGDPQQALDISLIGFKTVNTSPSRIAGFEVSSYLNAKIGKLPVRLWGGYTYSYPADMDTLRNNNLSYMNHFFDAFYNPDSTTIETILRYRSLHTARLDLEFDLKPVTLGFAAIYNGYIWQIDDVFIGEGTYGELIAALLGGEIIPGFTDFRERTREEGGTMVYDARVSVDVGKYVKLHFIVNNILNKEYAIRPGRMEAPRSFNLKCQITF